MTSIVPAVNWSAVTGVLLVVVGRIMVGPNTVAKLFNDILLCDSYWLTLCATKKRTRLRSVFGVKSDSLGQVFDEEGDRVLIDLRQLREQCDQLSLFLFLRRQAYFCETQQEPGVKIVTITCYITFDITQARVRIRLAGRLTISQYNLKLLQ